MKGLRAEITATVPFSGEELLGRLRAHLDVWGGMDHSVNPDEDGRVSCSFDADTANGGVAGIIAFMDQMGVEYDLRLMRWLPVPA